MPRRQNPVMRESRLLSTIAGDDDLTNLVKLGLVEATIEEGEVRYRISHALLENGKVEFSPIEELLTDG